MKFINTISGLTPTVKRQKPIKCNQYPLKFRFTIAIHKYLRCKQKIKIGCIDII